MSARTAPARDGESRRARRNQLVLFSAIAAAVLMVFAFWLAAGGSGPPRPEARIDAELATPGTAEESWTRRSEARLGAMDARLRDMEAGARRVRQENERLRKKLAADAEDARRTIDSLAAKIAEMERARAGDEAAAADVAPAGELFRQGAGQRRAPAAGDAASRAAPETESEAEPLIETFPLDGSEELFDAPAVRDIGAWLPAGSHAKAVVLAGVDASAGVSSQGDPRPVLLRIVGPAWTAAAGGTALAVDIDGCTVTGAAHGDLSSEKVYARLRTLTCAGDEPDTVLETEVAGFVAGAGKTGVRGPVVSREGALVEKAFLAGMVSGLGEGVSGAFAPQAVASGTGAAVSGTSVANAGLDDIGRAGLGSGAASAGRKVADYLIRRAEQYQPVIQLQAGTRVTVVFIEGAWLDGRTEKGKRND